MFFAGDAKAVLDFESDSVLQSGITSVVVYLLLTLRLENRYPLLAIDSTSARDFGFGASEIKISPLNILDIKLSNLETAFEVPLKF